MRRGRQDRWAERAVPQAHQTPADKALVDKWVRKASDHPIPLSSVERYVAIDLTTTRYLVFNSILVKFNPVHKHTRVCRLVVIILSYYRVQVVLHIISWAVVLCLESGIRIEREHHYTGNDSAAHS